MSTKSDYPHLTLDTDGQARIGTTRYTVSHLAAEHYQYGWTAQVLRTTTRFANAWFISRFDDEPRNDGR
jgi:hypothetical protein